jgi:multidrug resistance efflux pump
MSRRRSFFAALSIVALTAVAALVWTRVVPSAAPGIPTGRVQKGQVQLKVYTTGELRAARSTQVVAPPIGGQMQIVSIAQSGQFIHQNDPIVEFDLAEQEFQLEQSQFDLASANQELAKADAEAAVQVADDEVALLHGRFDVRRAELAASGNELISDVEAKKNTILLEEAKQKLAQLEHDVQSHRETTRASSNVLREKRNKAQLSVQVAQRNIDNLVLRAPFDGFVVVRENYGAFGGPIFPGMPIPEFRAGDTTFSGSTIADLVDTSRLEVSAKVPEGDRANLNAGQPTDVSVDAVPGLTLHGTVRAISSVANRSPFANDVVRQFDVLFDISGLNERVRPGITAQIAIGGATLNDALYVPRQAIFESGGRTVVYVRTASGFDAREIKVRARTESVAVVENIEPGLEIALVDPRSPSGGRPRPSAATPSGQRASR